MLGSAIALTSSIPGAFASLGVGMVTSLAALLLVRKWPPETFGLVRVDLTTGLNSTEQMSSVLPIILAFSGVFIAYAIGQSTIGLGCRLRSFLFEDFDPQRAAYIASSGNEFLQKSFLELKATNSALDGLGLANAFLFLSIGFTLFPENGTLLPVLIALGSPLACWSYWREAHRRYDEFDQILRAYRAYSHQAGYEMSDD